VRLVLDTNTVVSGLVWAGVPGQLIDSAVASKVHLIASLPLLDELQSIVSGDSRLLAIGEYRGIPIITPATAVRRLVV
jgi:predicted nucleic acid-binding protein